MHMFSNAPDARAQRAFTIVELLIAIVVIGILATISVVAYLGIQERARDAVVVTDLRNNIKQIELISVNEGVYPMPSAFMNHPEMSFVSSGSEAEGATWGSWQYCHVAPNWTMTPINVILAVKSRSGKIFVASTKNPTPRDVTDYYAADPSQWGRACQPALSDTPNGILTLVVGAVRN